MGGRAQGPGDSPLRTRRRQPAPARAVVHDDGTVDREGDEPIERSAWRRPKYVQTQADADELDEQLAPRRSAAERPTSNSHMLAKYVRACALNPDPDKPVFRFYSWKPGQPWEGIVRGPFFCKSWRCQWGCADHEAHVMFARIAEAFEPFPAHELVFVVLTLDSQFHALDFSELDQVYKELRARLEWFRKRLRRQLEKQGLGDFGKRWIAVIEQHETGVPHVNLVMHCPAWASWLETRRLERKRNGQRDRTARLIANTLDRRDDMDRVWLKMLNECGFGFASTAEQVRSKGEVLGYCAGVARHADATAARMAHLYVGEDSAAKKPSRRRRRRRSKDPLRMLGELAKKRQLPLRAPKGFRRLRSGVGFLPPRHKGDKTGCIVHHVETQDGYQMVQSVTKMKDEAAQRAVAMCLDLERDRAWAAKASRESGEAAARIERLDREIKAMSLEVHELEVMARRGGEREKQRWGAAARHLGRLKRERRGTGIERVPVPPDLLERFDLGPPKPQPPAPPGDPPRASPAPGRLPGMA